LLMGLILIPQASDTGFLSPGESPPDRRLRKGLKADSSFRLAQVPIASEDAHNRANRAT